MGCDQTTKRNAPLIRGTKELPFVLMACKSPVTHGSPWAVTHDYWEKDAEPSSDQTDAVFSSWGVESDEETILGGLQTLLPSWSADELRTVYRVWTRQFAVQEIETLERLTAFWTTLTDPGAIRDDLSELFPEWSPEDIESFYTRRADDIPRLKRSTFSRVTDRAMLAFIEQLYPQWAPARIGLVASLWGNRPRDQWAPKLEWLQTVVARLAAIEAVKTRFPDWEPEEADAVAVEWVGSENKLWKEIWPIRMSRQQLARNADAGDASRFVTEAQDIYRALLNNAYTAHHETLTFGRYAWCGLEPVKVAGRDLKIVALSLLDSGYTTYEAEAMAHYLAPGTTLDRQRELTGFLSVVSDDGRTCDLPVAGARHDELLRLRADSSLVRVQSVGGDGSTEQWREVLDELRREQAEQPERIILHGQLKPDGLEVEIEMEPALLEAIMKPKTASPSLPGGFREPPPALVGQFYTRQAILQIMGPPDRTLRPNTLVVALLSLYDHFRRGREHDCSIMEEYHYKLLGQVMDETTVLFLGVSWEEYSSADVRRLSTLNQPSFDGIRTPGGGVRAPVEVTELLLRLPQHPEDATVSILQDIRRKIQLTA